jgi:hypothetical protein
VDCHPPPSKSLIRLGGSDAGGIEGDADCVTEEDAELVAEFGAIVVFADLDRKARTGIDDVLDVTEPSASRRLDHAASGDDQRLLTAGKTDKVLGVARDGPVILQDVEAVQAGEAMLAKRIRPSRTIGSSGDAVVFRKTGEVGGLEDEVTRRFRHLSGAESFSEVGDGISIERTGGDRGDTGETVRVGHAGKRGVDDVIDERTDGRANEQIGKLDGSEREFGVLEPDTDASVVVQGHGTSGRRRVAGCLARIEVLRGRHRCEASGHSLPFRKCIRGKVSGECRKRDAFGLKDVERNLRDFRQVHPRERVGSHRLRCCGFGFRYPHAHLMRMRG